MRDAQYLISVLADEGAAQPQKIGATGYSYGGGISMALAALRDRTMLPDGSLVPWKSPAGKPMAIAAAVPQWPWTDLAYSLMPNGRTLDYVADAPYRGPDGKAPIGVEKASFVTGLYGLGLAAEQLRAAGRRPRRGPDRLVRADQRRRALRLRTRSRSTSSTRSSPTTPPTTSTTASRRRRC